MPGLLDYQAQPPAQPQYGPSDLLRFLGMSTAPNLTSLLTGQQAPPVANLPEQGKVPSVDPRMMGAAFELPGLVPGPGELMGLGVTGLKAAAPAFGMARRALMPTAEEAASTGIRAYHGSPYDFDRFDLSKIGTGEGNQAFGHGLYFAEAEPTAQSYKLAGQEASRQLDVINGKLTQLAREMDKYPRLTYDKFADSRGDALKAEYDQLLDQRAKLGHMYEVNINAKPEHFLDWDKPLAQQSPEVLKALGDVKSIAPEYLKSQNLTGGQIAQTAQAANELKEAGIPGIKYLDAGSRQAGAGSSNYVLFNDKLIDIMRKYGLAGLMGMGVTGQALKPNAGEARQ